MSDDYKKKYQGKEGLKKFEKGVQNRDEDIAGNIRRGIRSLVGIEESSAAQEEELRERENKERQNGGGGYYKRNP